MRSNNFRFSAPDYLDRHTTIIDALQRITDYDYDSYGNLTKTTTAKGTTDQTVEQYEYDLAGNRTASIDALERKTRYIYNSTNMLLQTIDPLGGTTTYNYDKMGHQTSVTDALGQTSTTAYNKVGNVVSSTDALNRITSYAYDSLNRRISTTDALNQTQTITYNILGNVSSSTDELGRTTSYEYDKVDRLTTTTDPLLHTTSTSYDTEGNVLTTTDAIGQKTTYLYDKNNRRIQVTDAKLGTTKTGYDAVGNVATITDSVNNTTTYGYDAVDRLITDTNQLNKTRTYSYDAAGNRTQTVDRNGRKVAYNYDTLNRQTSERWLDSNSATIKTFSASYDAVGHLVSATNPDSSYGYTYDAIDRVTGIDNTGTVGVPAVKFNYGYDAVGNLLSVNDSINGVSAGITGYSYDLLNRVTKLTQGGTGVQTKRVDMAYNAVNQLTSLSRFSGVNSVVATNYIYDNNQRLIQLSHKKGVSTVASYDYSYDNADKLASTVSSVDGTSNYNYDATNQLTGASHTAQTNEAYAYDANGNRTSGGTVTSANNQLLSDGTYSYIYDGEGNRTKRTEIASGKVTEYVWDYRNRLASVLFKDAGGTVTKTIEYIYDGNNQRIGKRIDGAVTERYVIDRNQIALVFDGAGVQTHRYLYGTQVDQVLADETATGMVWALADNQGTVRDLVDNSGVVVNHVTYDSFGRVVAQSNAGVEFRYGYTGREQDGETGLDYYRARYYDASNGRFISEDPLGFGAGDTNIYRYVGNSPTNWVDPSGLDACLNPFFGSLPIDHTLIASDLRKPTNTSIINNSKQRIYLLIGNEKKSHFEILKSGEATPDQWGRSKDVDGIWIWKGKIERWKFYPTEYPVTKGSIQPVEVDDKGVYYRTLFGETTYVNPWDGKSEKNSPDSRGKVSDTPNTPPNPKINYPNAASDWHPVAPEDKNWKNVWGLIEAAPVNTWYIPPVWAIPSFP